jgi:hypothetical protein
MDVVIDRKKDCKENRLRSRVKDRAKRGILTVQIRRNSRMRHYGKIRRKKRTALTITHL